MSSSTSFILTNINGYSANALVEVRGWVTLPTTPGPHSISVTYYYSYPSLVSYLTTYLISISSIPAHTSYNMGRFIYSSSKIPVYAGETSRLFFSLTTPSNLTKNAGYVSFTFPPSSFTLPYIKLTCEWDNGIKIWQSSACISTYIASTLSIQVLAPEYNDILVGT